MNFDPRHITSVQIRHTPPISPVQLYPGELVRIKDAPVIGAAIHSARGSAYLGTLVGIGEGGVSVYKDPHAPGPYELRHRQTGRTSRMLLRAVESFLDPILDGDTLVVVYKGMHFKPLLEKSLGIIGAIDPSKSLVIGESRASLTARVGHADKEKVLQFMTMGSFLSDGTKSRRFADVFVDEAIYDLAHVGNNDRQSEESVAVRNKAKRIQAGMTG